MKKTSRILITVASLMLALLYYFPLWKIDLQAPQYPEGLGLYISMNKITGVHKNDLHTINELNHYIGMKVITPEDIPELKIMPWVVRLFILLGLIAALTGKKPILGLWITLFLLGALAGVGDFYKWEYDYGHDLNPNAPIKVPGMSYQPPLIGVKQLLNMRTVSYPYIGGLAAMFSLLIGIGVWTYELKLSKKEKRHEKNLQVPAAVFL